MSQKSLLCLLSAVCILMYSEQHFHANCLSSEVVGRKFKGWDHCESLVSVCWPAWVWRNKAVWAAFNYLAVTRPMIPPPPPPLPIPPPPPLALFSLTRFWSSGGSFFLLFCFDIISLPPSKKGVTEQMALRVENDFDWRLQREMER